MNLLEKLKEVVRPSKLSGQFNKTLSVKIRCGQRVSRRKDGLLGTCTQTGTVDGTVSVPAICVEHDDGTFAVLVPAEEYMQACLRKY